MDSAINKTHERLNFVSQDKDFLRNYEMRAMALSDWTTGVNTAVEKAVMQVVKNSLSEGLPMETIQKITGLDIETIQSLK